MMVANQLTFLPLRIRGLFLANQVLVIAAGIFPNKCYAYCPNPETTVMNLSHFPLFIYYFVIIRTV